MEEWATNDDCINGPETVGIKQSHRSSFSANSMTANLVSNPNTDFLLQKHLPDQ